MYTPPGERPANQCSNTYMSLRRLPTHKLGQLSSPAWVIEPDKNYRYMLSVPACLCACVRVVLCCVDGRQFNTNSAEGKLWLFSPKLKSDGLLMFVCLFFLSRTTANFFFALCSHVFFRRGHSQKGKPSSEQGNMAVVWAVTSSCLSALYLSSAARHCHSPCRSLLPGVTDGSSLFAASLHSLVCVPFFSYGWLNDC